MEEVAGYLPGMYATFWALVPPLVAIILALITKEVYSSLFVGVVIGGLFYGNIFQARSSPLLSMHFLYQWKLSLRMRLPVPLPPLSRSTYTTP